MGSLIGQAVQLAQQAKSQEEKEKQKEPPDGTEKEPPDGAKEPPDENDPRDGAEKLPDGENDLPPDDPNRADDTARPEHEEASSGRQGERAPVYAEVTCRCGQFVGTTCGHDCAAVTESR